MKGCKMKFASVVLVAVAVVCGVWAAPSEKRCPVADGYPDWTGLTRKNSFQAKYVKTREMTPSDLRHKIVIVIELDVTDIKKLQTEQLPIAAKVARYNSYSYAVSQASLGPLMEMGEVPRSTVVLFSFRGKANPAIEDAFYASTDKVLATKIQAAAICYCPMYFGASMVGAPENAEGKYPFAYVLDGKSAKPVWSGVLTDAGADEIVNYLKKALKEVPAWTPLTGVAEPVTQKTAFRLIKEGKFKAAQAALLGGIKSKDPETAAEAQKMYDAIQQYQSDMVHLITVERMVSPALAYSDMQAFLKLFPSAKSDLAAQSKLILAEPGVQQLGDIITKIRLWKSDSYQPKNASEVKKNVREIEKWKKTLGQLEQSANMKIQGDAMYLASLLEALPSVLEAKVAR